LWLDVFAQLGKHVFVEKARRAYTVEDLATLAEGLRDLLAAIEAGSLKADAGTIARLEGATAAIQALADGENPAL
jgi:hypothetical protein